jgi:peptidoglycan/xylan/chitin deacetylase (PgdA/CDA1 family)
MMIRDYLKPLGGGASNLLLEHYLAGVAGRKICAESFFSATELDSIFAELSRRAESITAYAPDERFTWTREHLSDRELADIRRPRLDYVIAARLRERSPATAQAVPMWPDEHRFALCITHDVDHVSANNWREAWRNYSHARRTPGSAHGRGHSPFAHAMRATAGCIARRHVLRAPDRLAGVAEWMRLENEYGFKSTFFFVPGDSGAWHERDCNYRLSDKVPFDGRLVTVGEVMRRVADSGWEVGLHPGYCSATSAEGLRAQMNICQDALQRDVISVRQHTLQYDPNCTPAFQAQAGLSVDSTQGFNDLIGFRAGTSFPYLCWDWSSGSTLSLLELPLHIQDGPLLRDNATVDNAIESAIDMMKSVENVQGCLVILWHPHWLATDSGLAVFKAILGEAKNRNAWGCSAQQLAEWWLGRTNGIIQSTPSRQGADGFKDER